MTLLAILVIALILASAWGGMRLMQRTTGCTSGVEPGRPAEKR